MVAVRSFLAVFVALVMAGSTLSAYAPPSAAKSTDVLDAAKTMKNIFFAPIAGANTKNLDTLKKVAIATDLTIDRSPIAGTINANSISRVSFYRSGSKYYVDAIISPELPITVSVRGNPQTRQLQKVGFEFSDFADAAGAYRMLKAFAKDSLPGVVDFEPENCAALTVSGNPISCAVKGDKSGAFRMYETFR